MRGTGSTARRGRHRAAVASRVASSKDEGLGYVHQYGAEGQTGERAGGSRAGERAGPVGAVHDEQVASMTQVGVREKGNCNDAVPPLAPTTTVLIVQDEARVRVWVWVCGWRWLCHRKTTPVGKNPYARSQRIASGHVLRAWAWI